MANKGFTDIFKEYLTFDPTGQILQQRSQQGSGLVLVQDYTYDALGQLTNWTRNPGTGSQATEEYDYDSVGNRTLLTNRNNMGVVSSWRTYDIGRRTNLSAGPNQMLKSLNRNALAVFNYTTSGYDPDGSMTERNLYSGGDALLQEERFEYSSWRGLNWKYHRSTPRPSGGPLEWEWRYRYNAMGEREQKRETLTPNGDGTAASGYNWTYYMFGGRQRLTIWEGLQTSDTSFCSHPGTGSYVHLYPGEYITYGKSTTSIITKPTLTSSAQEYRIADHLGSSRVVLSDSGSVLSTADYKPFGEILSGSVEPHADFIDKERNIESQLGNFGVREYDYTAGRFTSIDPSWESFFALSPYHYSRNNPVAFLDINGLFPITFHTRTFAPWNTFGRFGQVGFHGDGENRRFTISKFASYRTGSYAKIETDNMSIVNINPYAPVRSIAYRVGYGTEEWRRWSSSKVEATLTGKELLIHTYGNNDAAPFSPDIDVDQKLKLSVRKNKDGSEELSLFGAVRGDNFPAVEAFVEDQNGTRIFLGVDAVEGAMRDVGPFILLWGRGLMTRANINMTIKVDSKGNFISVSDYTGTYTIEQWNKRFEQKSTTY